MPGKADTAGSMLDSFNGKQYFSTPNSKYENLRVKYYAIDLTKAGYNFLVKNVQNIIKFGSKI